MTKRLQHKKESLKWHHRYLEMAELVSRWSKHPEFQVGAVAVGDFGQLLSTGYNGWPRSIGDEEAGRVLPAPSMPSLTIHAEKNVIYNAGLNGVSLRGSTVYVFPMFPCVECAKALVQVSVGQICYKGSATTQGADKRWRESWRWAEQLFTEAGITVKRVDE